MGTSASETVEEIEGLRAQLDLDLRALEASLPPPSVVLRRAAVGGAVAVGLTSLATWATAVTRRRVRAATLDRLARRARRRQTGVERADEVLRDLMHDPRWRMVALGVVATSMLVEAASLVELVRIRRSETAAPRTAPPLL